jgi:hypothetical protein
MEEERSLAPRTLSVVGLGLLAFSVTILAGDIGTALLVTNSEQPCNSLVRSGDGASVVADVELPRREGVATRHFRSAPPLPASQQKVGPDSTLPAILPYMIGDRRFSPWFGRTMRTPAGFGEWD